MAVLVARQHFGVLFVQPQRRGGRCGGQIGCDAGFAEFFYDAVEPAEIPTILGGLDAVPAEDGEGDRVDAGFFHQADVVVPDLLRPLVGIVVAAECDTAAVFPSAVSAMRKAGDWGLRWVRRVCRYESARHCLSERIWYNRVPFDIFNLRYFCDSVKSRHTHVFAIDCDRLAFARD